MIDELIELNGTCTPLVLAADTGYGDSTAFRHGLTDCEIGHVAIKACHQRLTR